ncbi:hypothetical protein C1646_724769 [Rhizophagus diaphanus]|nr:hypothetical protein C1646_724769 [Rhizophagus diaphanus] [Rhizophagus sp. MUCL 43196]
MTNIPRNIRISYALSWCYTLQEPWTRRLIDTFVTPFINQGTVIPFRTADIMVSPPFC